MPMGRPCDDPLHSRLSRRRLHDRQPMHPAGAALRFRAGRSPFPHQRPANAARHGADVRGGCDAGDSGGELGRFGQPVWSGRRAGAAGVVRARAVVSGIRRSPDAALGSSRRAALRTDRDTARRSRDRRLVAARDRNRVALGALRRPDSRLGADRGRAARRKRRHDCAAAVLCARRGDFSGVGAAHRRPRLPGDEEIARCGRMDPSRCRSGGAAGGGNDRSGARYGLPIERFPRRHQPDRTVPARPLRHVECRHR